MKVDPSLDVTEKSLQNMLFSSSDFKSSTFQSGNRSYRLFYLDTMIELAVVQEHVIRPLLQQTEDLNLREIVSVLECSETELLSDAVNALVQGKTVLQIDGKMKLYLLGTEVKKERSVNLPVNERVLRGSNEALIENVHTNINLLRKMIVTPDLVVKYYLVGRRSNTKVALLYLQELANEEVIQEFERRISLIDIDYVEAPGFIQELIEDRKFSLFPQLMITERPDRVRSYLMNGKMGILTNGSPDCIILPVSFWAFLQSPDDYQVGWLLGSAFRFLRIISFVVAISLPGAYVALVTFDPRMLPFEIALTLQSSMQYVAMPPVLEAIFMLVTLEVLREATVRLASPIGQTIGVVGGIVIGTVVVQSNLVSTMMVIIVAFTAVASFSIPSYEMSSAVRLLSFPFILMAATFGLIGLELSYLIVFTHLARLNTMGIPYFYSGLNKNTIMDTLFRGPIRSLKERTKESLSKDNSRIRIRRGKHE
ncbi:spore gernimation protein GerA [Paenibacillus pectinilyticus]|uniref:Spore gernimation protein GerA n=1 Tax=Paenibacillus pectinilyticus TaxID=512399 RepID=A0A1C1A3Q5_9BACL|nr:spore germination protein [Paenibacillus pectinilyticus]OCT15194.1 spore gernimation protein GerA [Paenibacillus pectinilyticus]